MPCAFSMTRCCHPGLTASGAVFEPEGASIASMRSLFQAMTIKQRGALAHAALSVADWRRYDAATVRVSQEPSLGSQALSFHVRRRNRYH